MDEFYFTTTVKSQVVSKVILSHPCIINDMSRIRDSNGLIVASWCLTRNRERDVIISRMTSCPPPGLWHCTLYMALYNCTEQYRSLYPSSVSKRRSSDLAASSRHPPSELVSDRQYRIFSTLATELWCTCQATEWVLQAPALAVPGCVCLNMWLLIRCSINTGR